ncbi:MAG: 2-succinyl-5-enolpyruvyl-6-hydroxy-3-cyclohexene-1-carboxylic-acid synthase [Pseudomonadota bacterium]
MPSNYNYYHACQLVNNLVSLGLKDIVISPGSRSTPITLAAEHHPNLNCYYILDERSAAFFALGLANKQQPVALLATSGSAISNWFPAIVEASHSFVPLILLSADRPTSLQNAGANQTMNQVKIFGSFVRLFLQLDEMLASFPSESLSRKISQAVSSSLWPIAGPVHINIPINEPLIENYENIIAIEQQLFNQSVLDKTTTYINQAELHLSKNDLKNITKIVNAKKGIIICGRENYTQQAIKFIQLLSKKLNCPVFAEPLSNLRFSAIDNLIVNYDAFLRHKKAAEFFQADWIIRFGQFPVSKALEFFLLKQQQTHFIVCDNYGLWPDPLNQTNTMLRVHTEFFCKSLSKINLKKADKQWLKLFKQIDQQSHKIIRQYLLKLQKNQPVAIYEGHIITRLIKKLKNNSLLFSGNSMPVRDLDTFMDQPANKKSITIKANRGVSGIDGNISSFIGMLANKQNYSQAVALIGDLTCLHDLNGLALLKQLKNSNFPIVFIVINNSGGGIFNYLPQKQLDCFQKAWLCDQDMDFSSIASLYRLKFARVTQLAEFEIHLKAALSTKASNNAVHLIEVVIDQASSVSKHHSLFKKIKESLT